MYTKRRSMILIVGQLDQDSSYGIIEAGKTKGYGIDPGKPVSNFITKKS